MCQLRRIECRPAALKPAASPLVIGQQLVISDGPSHFINVVSALKVDAIIGNTTASPDGRGATELTAHGHGHRRMQCSVPFRRLGELLGVRIKLLIAALDQHHIEAFIGHFKRNRDAYRTSSDHG